MRAISWPVSAGKVWSCRGKIALGVALPSALPVTASAPTFAHPPGPLRARLFSVAVMWGGVIAMGRCRHVLAPAFRLRFSPLEIFAQRLFEPVLSWILSWILRRIFRRALFHRGCGLRLGFIPVILHRRSVRISG